jgi:hypothetical protein
VAGPEAAELVGAAPEPEAAVLGAEAAVPEGAVQAEAVQEEAAQEAGVEAGSIAPMSNRKTSRPASRARSGT